MNITERVQEVFNRFNVNLEVTEKTRTEMAEAALDNGTVIYTDAEAFAEGVEAFIINDEGERIPLPAGDYTFADGTVIVVGEGGVVQSVTAPEVEEAPAEAPAEVAELAEEDEEKKKEEMNYVTREEVEEMVMAAIQKYMDPKEEEEKEMTEDKEEDKEKMSSQLVQELSSIKAELSDIKKQAASTGLKHKAPAVKPEPVNLKNLNTQERVQAIHNQFSK